MSAGFWNGIIADHVAAQVAVAPKADTYRGWTVTQGRWPEPAWSATSPDYDASYEGPEDGWADNGEKASGDTYDELIAEIDEWFEDNGQFGVGA